ncbi:hypothetical protein ACB092_08G024200 [Castanea dentata]
MSLLVWNYRGLRNLGTEDQLADFVWAKDPSVVFLAETWTDKVRLEQAGGLAILGKEGFPLEVEKYSKNYIDTRHEAWSKLEALKNHGSIPWLCAGDFNEITKQSEKQGGRSWPHHQMQEFRDILDECGCMDLDFVGFPFTWHKHYPNFTIWERLDQAVTTNEWFSMFAGTKVHPLDVTSSDHKALWISPKCMSCNFQKPFCFEQMWMIDKGCSDTAEAVWSIHSNESWDTHVLRKLESCGAALSKWSKKSFSSVKKQLESACKQL